MNAFQMLLVLGFPPAVAAATIAPDTFIDSIPPVSLAPELPVTYVQDTKTPEPQANP